jgi:hypothetical protein
MKYGLKKSEKMTVIENLIGLIQDDYPTRDKLTSPEYVVEDFDLLSDEDQDREFDALCNFVDRELIPYLTSYYLKIKREEV